MGAPASLLSHPSFSRWWLFAELRGSHLQHGGSTPKPHYWNTRSLSPFLSILHFPCGWEGVSVMEVSLPWTRTRDTTEAMSPSAEQGSSRKTVGRRVQVGCNEEGFVQHS